MNRMQTIQKYRTIIMAVIIVIVVLGLLFLGGTKQGEQAFPQQPQQPIQSPPVLIKASGATFPEAQLRKWIQIFTSTNKDISIEYSSVGSGQGISDFLNGLTTFGCSDIPLTTDQLSQAKSRYSRVYQIPYLLGGVAIVYNIPEIEDKQPLKLTPEVLVDILLGKIIYWDDPKIKELNPELVDLLPHKEIYFIHRSEASGTTEIFTMYLSQASKEWTLKGKTIEWPLDKVGRGEGQKGNPGVALRVQQIPYSCLLYTSPSPRDRQKSRMPSSA